MTGRRAATGMLLAVLVAAGCWRGGDDGRTTVEVLVAGDPVETAGYEALAEAFEADVEDVDIELVVVAGREDLLARLSSGFAGGRPPDAFLVNHRYIGQLAAAGALDPVGDRLVEAGDIDLDDLAPAAVEAFRVDGRVVCLPQNQSSLVAYYNADLFEQAGLAPPEPGWTWDDLVATATALTHPERGVWGLGVEPSLIRLAPFVWSNGGEVVDDREAPTAVPLGDGPGREALDFFLDLQLVHGVVPPDREEQGRDREARFLDGDLGLLLESRRVVPTLRTVEDFVWDVAPLPVAPAGEPASVLHSDGWCVAAEGDVGAAARFVEFALGEEGQRIVAQTGRTVPSRRSVAASPAFLDPDRPPASAQVFLDAVPMLRVLPSAVGYPRAEGEADRVLEDLFYGRVDREEGVRRLVERTGELLRDGG